MSLRRILLSPLSGLWGLVLWLRHGLYDLGLLRSTRPTLPTIAIGNLALGGTGKTPMMELVLRSLEGIAPIATLSRGYGRKTTTIHEVILEDDAARSGDEPLQVKHSFPEMRVFVGADRVKAIEVIQREVPDVKAIVLDDALQHRPLDAGLNILLTTFQRPYCDDALLPAGTLRDLLSRANAAQVVVVTKCPALPSAEEQLSWRGRLNLKVDQTLFFAGIGYQEERKLDGSPLDVPFGEAMSALVFTGIVQPEPFLDHVRSLCGTVEHLAFQDHHDYTPSDLKRLADVFGNFAAGPKTLITTEKDAARLRSVIKGGPLEGISLAVIGMRTIILNEPERFEALIHDHVRTYQAHR